MYSKHFCGIHKTDDFIPLPTGGVICRACKKELFETFHTEKLRDKFINDRAEEDR